MKYFKKLIDSKVTELLVDPIEKNHKGLVKIEKEEFDILLSEKNKPSANEILKQQIAKAKDFLNKTEHKFITDYTLKDDETLEDIAEIRATRAEARAFIRANK